MLIGKINRPVLWTAGFFEPKGAGACLVLLHCKKKMRGGGHPAAKGVGSVAPPFFCTLVRYGQGVGALEGFVTFVA